MSMLGLLLSWWLACFAVNAGWLWLASRWLKTGRRTFLRASLAVGGMVLIGAAGAAAQFWAQDRGRPLAVALPILLLTLAGSVLLPKALMQAGWGKALVLWLLMLIPQAGLVGAALWVIRPRVEGFVCRGNAMAPTLLGGHVQGQCPHCSGVTCLPAPDDSIAPFHQNREPQKVVAICAACWRTTVVEESGDESCDRDRVLVDHRATPRRWDIVVYRVPEDKKVWVHRVAVLPGETAYIENGELIVNGSPLAKPPHLERLRYESAVFSPHSRNQLSQVDCGVPNRPWVLGSHQYVLLGDNSLMSYDSRFVGPVDGANIDGVVGLCYWPPARMRIFH